MADLDGIERSVGELLQELPNDITLVAAVKSRRPEEVEAAIKAGVTCIGHNYVQEAERMVSDMGLEAQWHMIGHLQRNKVGKALQVFDLIETVDSLRLAAALDRNSAALDRVTPVLVEINSGREASKTGVLPEAAEELIRKITELDHIEIRGLMTMGPRFGDPEDARPFFRATRKVFETIASLNLPSVSMETLSMGMSNSYKVAIEEGSTMVRIGSRIFGARCEG